ncbi:MAG: carboxypeptidase-like regulatory domain-containing protein [Janthinobacterium lividum]
MKTSFYPLPLLLALVAPAPLLAQPATAPAAAAATRTISGRVLDGRTGETLPGATVLLRGTRQQTATDTEGHYTLAGVPTTGAVLVVRYVGYVALSQPVPAIISPAPLDVKLAPEAQLLAAMDDGIIHRKEMPVPSIQRVPAANIQRKPPTTHPTRRANGQATRTISGYVTDTAGQGQPDVLVLLKDTEISTCTNTDGFYSLAGVPVQEVVLLLCVINPGTRAFIAQPVPAAAGVTRLNGVLRHKGGGPLGGPK